MPRKNKLILGNFYRPRNFNKTNLLFKDMYVALIKNKKVTYMTEKDPSQVENHFKFLFGAEVKAIKKDENNFKLIYNEKQL